ncbi:MAG: peptide ABC transporter substrate-binding protein [Planctomycetales bacterium]|nr:peptide ABC transporter substrate-binding protein [Planctomycetales bacterium]
MSGPGATGPAGAVGLPDGAATPAAPQATWPPQWGPQPAPTGWDKQFEPTSQEWRKHAQVLRFNNGTEIETLDPARMTGVPEHRIIMAVCEGLTMYHPVSSEPMPGAAESWVISDGGRTYTFRIRADARWSNGDTVTAADYRYSWWRVLAPQPPSQYSYMLFDIENAKAFAEGRIAETPLALHRDAERTQPNGQSLAVGEIVEVVKTWPDPLPENPSDEEAKKFSVEVKCGEKSGWVGKSLLRGAWQLDGPGFAKVGIEAPGVRTLVVRLSEPKPFFLEVLSHETSMPVHPPTVEKHGNQAFRAGVFVGNGPYVLKSWEPRVRMVFEKNPAYWGRDRVELDRIVAHPVENMEPAYAMYKADEVDWLMDVPLAKIDEVKLHPDYYVAPLMGTYFYRVNCTARPHPDDPSRPHPLTDRRVRQALNMAMDKKTICEKVTKAGQIPASGYVPPGTAPWYEPLQGLPHDRERARALLAEAGYPGGKGMPKIEILYNTLESHKTVAEAIADMWQQNLGITVGLHNAEWKVYLDQVDRIDYHIARAGWIGDYLDPNTFLDMWVTKGGNNNTGWSHPEYDRLIERVKEVGEPTKRRETFRTAERILCVDELPILPIYYYVNKGLKKPKVRGVHMNIKDMHPWQYIWIEPEE